MERNATWILSAAALAVTTTVNAQGYFSFSEIPGLDAEPTVEIDLNPTLLGFVTAAADGANGEAADALAGITNVRVRVYENVGDDMAAVLKFVEDTSATLERDGWQSAVRVRGEDGEQVRIYMKPAAPGTSAAGTIGGLTVMVADGTSNEAVFINVAGTIQPAQLGRIAGAMGMNGMFNRVPGVITPAPNTTGQ